MSAVEPCDDAVTEIIAIGVSRILLTNRNHSRAANRIRQLTGAGTAIHADDADHARSQDTDIDSYLTVGGRIGPLEVIGAAGKSPGEVALYWRDRGILIVGDAIIGNPPGACSLLNRKVCDNFEALQASVSNLLDVDFETLLVGDGVPILSGARAKVQDLVDSFAV